MARSIYGLRDEILKEGRLVLPLAQLASISGVPRSSVKVYADRLVRKGFARRIIEGTIALTGDPFVVATQLVEPSYISFTSAFYLHELIKQVPSLIECVTTRNTRKFQDLEVIYHHVRPSLLFGYARMEKGGSYVFVAKPEKALLDMIYFGRLYSQLSSEVLGHLDRRRLRSYATRFSDTRGFRARRIMDWVKVHAG